MERIWEKLRENLPYGDSDEERKKREEQFKQLDVNGNGLLSLTQIDNGIRDVLGLPDLFESKPVLICAFTAAKNKNKTSVKHADDCVDSREYRYLLKYLRQYFEYWVVFKQMDTSGDKRIAFEEF